MALRLRHLIEFTAFRMVVAVVHLMPMWVIDLGATLAGFCIHRLLPRRLTRYDIAARNIRRALGPDVDTDRMIGLMWRHLFRTVGEVIHLRHRLSRNNFRQLIRFRNEDQAVNALISDRPVILISGHLGNWELAVWIFGVFGFPMGVVARRLDNPFLDRFFFEYRADTGHELLDKNGASGEMVDRLESARHLAMLGDQDAGSHGLFVDFMGHPASTFKSIALLALRYQALICVGYAIRLDKDNGPERFEVGCEELIDTAQFDGPDAVLALTQAYTTALERVVRRAPEQYFWVHRRWKSKPNQSRRRSKRGRTGSLPWAA